MLGSILLGQQESEGRPGRSLFLRVKWKPTGHNREYFPTYHGHIVHDFKSSFWTQSATHQEADETVSGLGQECSNHYIKLIKKNYPKF